MINIVLFGKPGQKRNSSRILKENITTHLSTGDIF
jgi:hypothetical protein